MKPAVLLVLGFLFALLGSLILGGCQPSTIPELRKRSEANTFYTNINYQKAFRDIKSEVLRCEMIGFISASSSLDANLYTDIKRGDITMVYNNMGDISTLFNITIKKKGSRSKVTTYSSPVGWDGFGMKIQNFIKENNPLCERKDI